MRINEIITEAVKQRLDAKCWTGKHKEGTKIKGGVRVNNCVPDESVEEGSLNEFAPGNGGDDDEGFSPEIAKMAQEDGFTKGVSLVDGATLERAMSINYWHSQHGGMYKQYFAKGFKTGRMNKINHDNKQYNLNLKLMKDGSIRRGEQSVEETAAWKRKEGKNKKGGLNQKGVDSYRKEHPGSKLQTAVTTKPSKLKPGSKDAKRRKSFCARMSGMEGPMKKPNGEPTRKALALRKWHCESVEHFVEMFVENMDHTKDNQAVPELKAALLARKDKLQTANEDQVYDIIDSIMTRIAKSHGISGQKLHDMWVNEYDQVPDTWIMK